MARSRALEEAFSKAMGRNGFGAEAVQRTASGHIPDLSSYHFGRRFYRQPLRTPQFHMLWYETIDGAVDAEVETKVFIEAPREHAKTTVVIIAAARYIAKKRRSARVGIISGNDILAKARLREVKGILTQPEVERAYGIFKPTGFDTKWDAHEIVVQGAVLGKDVTCFAFGAGSQVTGSHCDLLIFDDIETVDSVLTPEGRNKTKRWFATEAMNVLSPGGTAIVIGTRKHFDDLYSMLLDPDSGFISLDQYRQCWMVDPDTDEYILDRDGRKQPIWPEKWPYEALMARKTTLDRADATSWSQEFLNLPLSGETQPFHPEEWPQYDYPDGLPKNRVRCIAVDLALRQRQWSDRSAIAVGSLDLDTNDIYLEFGMKGRWGFNEGLEHIDEVARAYIPTVIGIESSQYQLAAVEEFSRRTMWAVEELHADTDKIARSKLLEKRASLGKVFRPRDAPWWDALFEEAATFPAGAHDDLVDAFIYLAHMLAKMERKVPAVAPMALLRGGGSGWSAAP